MWAIVSRVEFWLIPHISKVGHASMRPLAENSINGARYDTHLQSHPHKVDHNVVRSELSGSSTLKLVAMGVYPGKRRLNRPILLSSNQGSLH